MARRFFQAGLGFALLIRPAFSPARAEETPEPFRSFVEEAQKRVAEFPEVPIGTEPGKHRLFTVRLDEKPVVISGEHRFGCLRFTAPPEGPLDMVWAFAVPEEWRHWYIVPASGSMKGFRNWLNADRLYEGLPTTARNPASLQTLGAASFTPGATYVLWFKQEKPMAAPSHLVGMINFLPPRGKDEKWDAQAIEEGLGLKTAAATKQVEYLASRGGRILLDARFFRPQYAEARIDDLLSSLRHSRRFADGRFIEMRVQVPPSGTDPVLSEVQAAHGEPDLILTAEERRLFDEDAEPAGMVCYYDRFGFIVREKAGKPYIVSVLTEASDVSIARAQRDGLTWSDVPLAMIDLRIFYRDRKEIGRVAFWGKGEAKLLSGAVPEEVYRKDHENGKIAEELKPLGHGEWEYRGYYGPGALFRTAKLRGHTYHGVLRDFYPDGKPKAEATYVEGELDGAFKQWSETGEVRERRFRRGKRIDE